VATSDVTTRPAPRRRRRASVRDGGARASLGRWVLAAVIALLFLLPLWWTVVSALRPQSETFDSLSDVSVWTLIPRTPTLNNLSRLFAGDFARALFNSALVTLLTLVIGLAISATAAFALAVLDFPGRAAIFGVMVVSFLIPFDAIAIPLSSIFRDAGLQNSYAALILPGIGNGFAVFLLRQFFLGIPRELTEAARVDGLGWWRVFWYIFLPLSRPALIGAGLILFVFQWQSYLWPLLIAPDPSMRVAPVAIAQFAGEHGVDFGLVFAGAVMTAVVPLLVLLFFQRYFTQSLAATGGKE
jgi:putative chitobiose transport system permease protein